MASSGTISSPVDFTKSINLSYVKDKTALVTGAASGNGAAIAKALAEAGATVTIADLNEKSGNQYASSLTEAGLRAFFVHTDVTSWDSQAAAFKHCAASSPDKAVDLVISCAGVDGPSLLQQPSSSGDDDSPPHAPSTAALDVNLKGAYYTSCLSIWYFRRQASRKSSSRGCLVLIASSIAYHSMPFYTIYTASKAGVRGLWRTIRDSPDLTHMRCNLLAPHIVRSPMTAGLAPMLDEKGIEMVKVEEVVEGVMRLVCDEGVSGRAVQVNPGGSVFDVGDDEEGWDGARAIYEREGEVKGVMEFMTGLLRGS